MKRLTVRFDFEHLGEKAHALRVDDYFSLASLLYVGAYSN
jgi:hypothetical protein